MRPINWLLISFLLLACNNPHQRIAIFHSDHFVIADTIAEPNRFLAFNDHREGYPIYYIGPQKDTIAISHNYWRGKTKWKDRFDIPWSRKYNDQSLSIFIDTAQKTNSPDEYFGEDGQVIQDSSINYHGFIFYVKNIGDSTLYLGRTFFLYYMHLEAKNRNGDWVNVNGNLSEASLCLTNEPTILLNPGEIVISKMKRYRGPYLSELRLALGWVGNLVYSNIIRDSIDERTLKPN